MKEMPELITIKEFCEHFRITRPTFYAWLKEGKFEVIKINRSVRIRREELEKIFIY